VLSRNVVASNARSRARLGGSGAPPGSASVARTSAASGDASAASNVAIAFSTSASPRGAVLVDAPDAGVLDDAGESHPASTSLDGRSAFRLGRGLGGRFFAAGYGFFAAAFVGFVAAFDGVAVFEAAFDGFVEEVFDGVADFEAAFDGFVEEAFDGVADFEAFDGFVEEVFDGVGFVEEVFDGVGFFEAFDAAVVGNDFFIGAGVDFVGFEAAFVFVAGFFDFAIARIIRARQRVYRCRHGRAG
jgi:hypothetical protein